MANAVTEPAPAARDASGLDTEFTRGLGLYDSTMVVVGSMIGSGIFIVSADMARLVGSPGWLLLAWLVTGVLTVTAALSYGELAAMMPRAGGQYVYLREAFSPLWGFLYGWTLFLVIQTGTIAAVAVAFARFLGVLWPGISESHYLVAPIHLSTGYAISLSTAQLVGVLLIAPPDLDQHPRPRLRRFIQNVFTTAKTGAARRADRCVGLLAGWNAEAVAANFGDLWTPRGNVEIAPGLTAATAFGLFVAVCVAQTGSLFSSDAWNNITFTAGEVKNPRRNIPLSLALGTAIVIGLYLLANVAYLVTLPLGGDPERAVRSGRHGDARGDLPGLRRDADGRRDPHLDVRLHQRPDPGRRPRLLRDGPGRRVLRQGRHAERGQGAGLGAVAAGPLGGVPGAAADLQPGHRRLRQPLRQPARLRHLGGADLLHPDHRRDLPAARDAPRRRRDPTGPSATRSCRRSTSPARSPSSSCSSPTAPRRPGPAWSSSCWACRSISPGRNADLLGVLGACSEHARSMLRATCSYCNARAMTRRMLSATS